MLNFLQFKVVLLGESSVGKSSFALRFVKDYFNEFQESTIGAAFLSKIVVVNDVNIKLEIWDTAGQERYHSLAPMYYRGAHGALVLYDITNLESFHRAKNWIRELKEKSITTSIIALIGNKYDLEDERKVNELDAKVFAEEQGLIFMETSSKTSFNVHEVFTELYGQSGTTLKEGVSTVDDQIFRCVKRDNSEGDGYQQKFLYRIKITYIPTIKT